MSGITRTLGEPRVSVVQRSHREVVVTVAWDLSWYQFRVDMLGAQPVTLQRRGEELDEIESRFQDWNAHAEADGTLALAELQLSCGARSALRCGGTCPSARGRRRSRRPAALVAARRPAASSFRGAAVAAVDDHLDVRVLARSGRVIRSSSSPSSSRGMTQ